MRKVKILLAVVALTLAACSGGSEPAEITVSDAETGSAEEVNVETESSEETVTTDTDEPEKEESEAEQAEIEDEPAQPTPTVEPTPTMPEPTVVAVDKETRERAGQVYSMLVMAQAAAELLNETAIKSQEGELEGFEWFGTSIVIGALASAVEEAQEITDPPESLKPISDDIFELNGMARDILARWYAEEIYAEDVILELEPILFHLEDVLSSAEVVMAEEYGVDASELAQVREEMVEELAASLDSAGEDANLETSENQDAANIPASITVADEYIEISGVGPSVSENFALDACYKSVFYSSVVGDGYPIINLHSVEDGRYDDVTRGEEVRHIELEGGTYFIEADVGSGTEWSIRAECQSTDAQLAEIGPAPEPMPEVFLELEGVGSAVSDNFALGSCYKGVFYSSVAGDGYPIINLHSIEDGRYDDVTRGEEVRHIELEGGTYFIEANVENGTEWSIRAECQSTDEQLAEIAPAPEPVPEVFLELEGVGSAVSDNFAVGSCYKGVFYSSVEGDDYPIINVHYIEDGSYDGIARGEDVDHIDIEAGTYFIEAYVENGTEWSVRGECQNTDTSAPPAEPAATVTPTDPAASAAPDVKVCNGEYLLDIYIVLDNAGMTDSIPLQMRAVEDVRGMLGRCEPNLDYDTFVERLDIYAAVLAGDEITGDLGILTPEDALMDVAMIAINAMERE